MTAWWWFMWGGFLLWICLLPRPSTVHAEETLELLYAKGVLEYSKRNYLEALEYLRQAVELAPDNADAQFYLGLTLTRLGEFDQGSAALEKTLQLDASKQYAHYHLGLAYFLAGRHVEALPQFEAAAQFDPQKAPTYFYLGQTLYELKRYSKALPHLQRAMELDPSLTPSAQYYRGLALYASEQDAQAQEAFEAVLQSQPDSPLVRQSQRYLEALAQRASARRPVQLQGSVSFEYDDNVILEPNAVEISGQADGRMVISVLGRLLPLRTPPWNLGVEYALFQSLHFDLSDFDIQSHTAGLFASLKLERVTLYAAANYNYTVISGPNAGDNGTATTAANGEATFTYTGDGGSGIDEIQASFVNPTTEEIISSNTVTKEWLAPVVIAIGDVTGNGVLDVDDARLILAVLVGLLSPVDVPNFGASGDVNDDNTINNLDAAIIAGILTGQVPLLPDSTRTTITDNGDGTATVAGSAGALPPNSTVNITNGGTTTVTAATDGSFSTVLTAVSGNKITIGVDNGPAKIALVVGDSDGDELSDAEESTRGTNPANPDTDGDGFPDGFEVAASSDPLDRNNVFLTFPLFLDFSRLDDPTQRLQ